MHDKLKDLKGRLLIHSGVVLFSFTLVYTSIFLVSKIILLIVCLALILAANWEFMHLVKQKGVKYPFYSMIPLSVLVPLVAMGYLNGYPVLPLFIFGLFFSLFWFFLQTFKQVDQAIFRVAAQIFSHVYITAPITLLLFILYIGSIGVTTDGRIWFFYLLAVAKGADIGGYFVGSLIGKHFLAKEISPKKTIEGSFGAFGVSIAISLFFAFLSKFLPQALFSLDYVTAIWLGFLMSAISQVGDLSESLLKRDAKVKDSSKIPAIGGVLDVIDSLTFTTPFLLIYLLWLR